MKFRVAGAARICICNLGRGTWSRCLVISWALYLIGDVDLDDSIYIINSTLYSAHLPYNFLEYILWLVDVSLGNFERHWAAPAQQGTRRKGKWLYWTANVYVDLRLQANAIWG